jgi:hypothetical protein
MLESTLHQHYDNMMSKQIGNASVPGEGSEPNTNPTSYSFPSKM